MTRTLLQLQYFETNWNVPVLPEGNVSVYRKHQRNVRGLVIIDVSPVKSVLRLSRCHLRATSSRGDFLASHVHVTMCHPFRSFPRTPAADRGDTEWYVLWENRKVFPEACRGAVGDIRRIMQDSRRLQRVPGGDGETSNRLYRGLFKHLTPM